MGVSARGDCAKGSRAFAGGILPAGATAARTRPMTTLTMTVPPGQARPGDLWCANSEVGMRASDGKMNCSRRSYVAVRRTGLKSQRGSAGQIKEDVRVSRIGGRRTTAPQPTIRSRGCSSSS